jgi:Flp pilus assembly protein TadG
MQPHILLRKKSSVSGQHLVEFLLVIPIFLMLIFGSIEIGRVWQAYEGAKLAALDGAYTASTLRDTTVAEQRIRQRLLQASLNVKSASVLMVNNGQAYEARVTVEFKPVFGGIKLKAPGGTELTLIPNAFDISYSGVRYYSVY